MDIDRETLGSIGETAMLQRIFPRLPAAELQIVGPGDDAAVLRAPDARYAVTTDMLIHGPDFRLAWSTFFELGWKAAATNLADIAAMGGTPTALVLALASPSSTSVRALEDLADGMRLCCAELAPGCGVVGGDLSVSPTLTLAVTAFGDLDGLAPVLRSGAQVGDVIAYAGDLGRAAAGLALLFAKAVNAEGEPSASRAALLRVDHADLLSSQFAPSPPIRLGALAARGGATAMLDVSDGLILDASRIARASGVQLRLSSSALADDIRILAGAVPALADLYPSPQDAARDLVLAGGEDHGLLATFPSSVTLPDSFRRIGEVTAGDGASVDGAPYESAPGWDPFAGWNGGVG